MQWNRTSLLHWVIHLRRHVGHLKILQQILHCISTQSDCAGLRIAKIEMETRFKFKVVIADQLVQTWKHNDNEGLSGRKPVADQLAWFGLVWFGLVLFGLVWFENEDEDGSFLLLEGIRCRSTRAPPLGPPWLHLYAHLIYWVWYVYLVQLACLKFIWYSWLYIIYAQLVWFGHSVVLGLNW